MTQNSRFQRYQGFTPLTLPDRTWPDQTIVAAPRWLSTDLRDGNQSLANPMTPARKLAMFDLLVDMGYKEIEVGFPVASQDEFDFVRMLIEGDRIPDDVRISVLVQARDELIRRTVESLKDARRATVHVYNATAPMFREVVFGMSRAECRDLAVHGTRLMMKYTSAMLPDCEVGYQYSPELFNQTEPDFALEVCEAVMDTWQPSPGRELILNLPTTVERSLPNVFADQIEWMNRNLSRHDNVCLSVHPHNDRGTGVASTELALLAGAQRVEGCLFGNGERAGNVCLVTLGLNMFTHGVDPGIDFSDIDRVRRVVEYCTGMPVPPRHPYGGELVYTAFSGSHQDAIKKGFDALDRKAERAGAARGDLPWEMPYLPLDPEDVGRSYDAVVRINSQSGKGGLAYIMSAWFGLHLPRELQIEFAGSVQELTQSTGAEVSPEKIRRLFEQQYVEPSRARPPMLVPVSATVYIDDPSVPSASPEMVQRWTAVLDTTLSPWGAEIVAVVAVNPADEPVAVTGDVTVYARCAVGAAVNGAATVYWGVASGPDLAAVALRAVQAANGRARAVLGGRFTRTDAATCPIGTLDAAVTPRLAGVS